MKLTRLSIALLAGALIAMAGVVLMAARIRESGAV